MRLGIVCSLLLLLLSAALNAEAKKDENKRKKSVLDLSDRDVQRIYEQWEVCDITVMSCVQ